MTLSQAVLLGLTQGLTEFLPVSSSGHLVIGKRLLGATLVEGAAGPVMELIAHLGTLLAVLIVFRRALWGLARYGLWGVWVRTRREGPQCAWWEDSRGRLLVCIVVATLPTAAIGLGFEDFFHEKFGSARAAGAGLLATSGLLCLAQWRRKEEGSVELPGLWMALAVGLAQGAAIFPGLSRSGATIVAALLLGLRRERAFEFSFLISVPAILGAAVLELGALGGAGGLSVAPTAGLFTTSLVAGLGALVLLRAVVIRGALGWFALYCFPVGVYALFFM
jgi:undecaprenyl-diphosphatase